MRVHRRRWRGCEWGMVYGVAADTHTAGDAVLTEGNGMRGRQTEDVGMSEGGGRERREARDEADGSHGTTGVSLRGINSQRGRLPPAVTL